MGAVESLLDGAAHLTLATCGATGEAWACDLLFVHEGLRLYWKSDTASLHSRNIAEHPQAAATVTSATRNGCGIQVSGRVEAVGNTDFLELRLAEKRCRLEGKEPADREAAREGGRGWYVLVPERAYYLDEQTLGYGRTDLLG